MKQEELIGLITENADVKLEDGRLFSIDRRGTVDGKLSLPF